MKGKGFFFILCVCMTFISCSNVTEDKNDVRSNDSVLKFLDIQNAKNLYIGTSNSGTRSARNAATTQKLFKITEEGYVEEVKYLDENKKEITISQQPTVIQNVNDDYIFVGFGWSGYVESSYLVRKTDGAVFDMTKAGNPNEIYNDFKNSQRIKTDGKNNMYFLSYDTQSLRIVKVNLNGIDALNSSFISASTDYVDVFDVDWNGNLIYDGYSVSDSSHRLLRVRKSNGGLLNLSDVGAFWIGLDGNIYYSSNNHEEYKNSENGEESYGYPIKKITIDLSSGDKEEIYGYIDDFFWTYGSFKINVKDKIYIIRDSLISEVYNSNNSPRKVSLTSLQLKSVTAVTSSENYYYVAGLTSTNETVLLKINPDNDSFNHILPENEYEVFSFTASETDGITFNALRMSDGKKIIGQVGINGGEVTILDEESDAEITYLQRIN
ncbi:MAG: hypothetical protein J6R67_08395 [Treponema sp.]|nr:hypothetical protein [Treponema sp.]